MEHLLHLQEYNAFLKWFKKNYPALFSKYNDHILVAGNNGRIRVIRDDLPQRTYDRLVKLTEAYYDKEKMTG